MFHAPETFAFLAPIQQAWQTILSEYRAVEHRRQAWPETRLYSRGWSVYGLFDFPHGEDIADNQEGCPVTTALIRRHVPHHGAAGFSRLAAGSTIHPHTGYPGSCLRAHLALEVPAGDCALRVAGEVRQWREGTFLVFDDRVTHDAWNHTAAERVVLLLDFRVQP